MVELFGIIAIIALVFFGMVIGYLFKAYIISQIWGWYMVPLFGVGALPMIFAMGLLFLIDLINLDIKGMKADTVAEKELTDKQKVIPYIGAVLAYLLVWGLAAIGRRWIPEDFTPVTERYLNPVPIVETVDGAIEVE
jgi:hypothetical protein